MIPLDLSPLLDGLTLPDDDTGEELILGWRSINPDGADALTAIAEEAQR